MNQTKIKTSFEHILHYKHCWCQHGKNLILIVPSQDLTDANKLLWIRYYEFLNLLWKLLDFVYLNVGVFRPTRFIPHHYRWRAINVDLFSALMVIEQWGFFIRVLWLGTTLYNGHLRGPVTFKPVSERLAVHTYMFT